jgi:sigma-B regulation protein RsbU (phosphoserine phosphatase)
MTKILVVDDEPDVELLVRQKFRRRIRGGELTFLFAGDGVEALKSLEDNPDIDMVLSDINMPRMDGLTLLDQLSERNPMIKAVIVSAYGDMKNIRIAMNRGAFDFVTKPINFEDLEITVDKTLKHLKLLRDALSSHDQLVAIQRELDVAYRIQQSILPQRFPATDRFEIRAGMTPARDVGGDFYDFFELGDDRLGIAIADVSGKGIAAALFMAHSRTVLRTTATEGLRPGPCLTRVNNLLASDNESEMFVTLFYGILEVSSGRFAYANGGHNAPYLIRNDGTPTPLELTGGMALGVMDGLPYAESEITLRLGDRLFLYTDGVTEAMDVAGSEYGNERLSALLRGCVTCSPSDILERIDASVREFAGEAPQADDITCFALRFGPPGPAAHTEPDCAEAPAGMLEITLANRLDELHHLSEAVASFGAEHGLDEQTIYRLNLALDELITNTISYGFDDEGEHQIVVRLWVTDGTLKAELQDDGQSFDPLSAPAPDIEAPVETRAIGGLGIHFVKSMMDHIDYHRVDGKNRLVMSKLL